MYLTDSMKLTYNTRFLISYNGTQENLQNLNEKDIYCRESNWKKEFVIQMRKKIIIIITTFLPNSSSCGPPPPLQSCYQISTITIATLLEGGFSNKHIKFLLCDFVVTCSSR